MKRVLSNILLGAVAFTTAVVPCMAQTVFEETFEDPENPAFNGWVKSESENPASGKYCASLTGTHGAHGKIFIPVEPNQWYRHSLVAYAWADPRQSFMTDPELQSYYRAVVAMFHRLEPVLRNPAEEPIKITSSQDFVESGTFEDGKDQVLLLVNLSNDIPVDVVFTHPAKQTTDFFDPAWKYLQKDGKFRFTLATNESKVLRLIKN